MSNADRFRNLLKQEGAITLPGVYDCVSAKVAEKAGFKCLFTSGFGISASSFGKPDIGLISVTQTIGVIKNIVDSINVPLIVDLDTGYGGPVNVFNTVNEVCRLGVAGFILEDQVWPKKCGHMEGKQVIPEAEFIEKINAARHASENNHSVLIARTDSLAVYGIDNALERGRAYLDAGADILFIEAPTSKEDLVTISKEFKGKWLFANMVEGGKTPILSHEELESLGFKVIVYPLTGLFSSTKALTISYNHLIKHNSSKGIKEILKFSEFEDLINLQNYKDMERKFKD